MDILSLTHGHMIFQLLSSCLIRVRLGSQLGPGISGLPELLWIPPPSHQAFYLSSMRLSPKLWSSRFHGKNLTCQAIASAPLFSILISSSPCLLTSSPVGLSYDCANDCIQDQLRQCRTRASSQESFPNTLLLL